MEKRIINRDDGKKKLILNLTIDELMNLPNENEKNAILKSAILHYKTRDLLKSKGFNVEAKNWRWIDKGRDIGSYKTAFFNGEELSQTLHEYFNNVTFITATLNGELFY